MIRRLGSILIAAAIAFTLSVAGAASAPTKVSFDKSIPVGTIVVMTKERRLYYVISAGVALRYPVGVGRAGKQWQGQSAIEGKYVKPDWAPPPDIRAENPLLPKVIPGGAPNNPMGAAVMVLNGGKYGIHGTNRPGSIGGFVSHGCIRMYNQDVLDLFARVHVGTPVIVRL